MFAVTGAAQLGLEAAGVLRDFVMITALDYAPERLRRQVLSGEYKGEALEQRLQMQIGGGWPMLKALWHFSRVQNHGSLAEGATLPVGSLDLVPIGAAADRAGANVNIDTSLLVDLAALGGAKDRPLVLNFGSCSWPPFMGSLKQFVDLAAAETRADYAVIYLEEAHPTSGWMYPAVEQRFRIQQHTSLEDRHSAAARLRAELNTMTMLCSPLSVDIPMYADGMDNRVSRAFGALPERLVILYNGKVWFVGGKGPQDYSVSACANALARLFNGVGNDRPF